MGDTTVLVLIILMVVICEACAQSSAQVLSQTDDYRYLLLGMLFYGAVVYLLSRSHKISNMATANGMMSCLSIIMITFVGYYIFQQKIKSDHVIALCIAASSICYLTCTT